MYSSDKLTMSRCGSPHPPIVKVSTHNSINKCAISAKQTIRFSPNEGCQPFPAFFWVKPPSPLVASLFNLQVEETNVL